MKDFWASLLSKTQPSKEEPDEDDGYEMCKATDFRTTLEALVEHPFSVFGSRTAQEVVYIKGQRVIAWAEDGEVLRFICGDNNVPAQTIGVYRLTGRVVGLPREHYKFSVDREEFKRVSLSQAAQFFLQRHEVGSECLHHGVSAGPDVKQQRRIAIQRAKADFHSWLNKTQLAALGRMHENVGR